MARLKRGGREIVVDDKLVTEYLRDGYSVIDERGNDVSQLKALDYVEALRKIDALTLQKEGLANNLAIERGNVTRLEKEVERLKAELETATQAVKTARKKG